MYLPERDLINLLLTKENYNKFFEFLDMRNIKDNYRELHYVYLCLKELHELVATDLSLTELQAFFFQKYPDVDNDLYLGLFRTLSETTLSDGVGVALLTKIKQRQQALKLSEAAFNFSNGNGDIDALVHSYDELSSASNICQPDDEEYVTTNLEEILTELYAKPGLRWRLDALNKSLGSLRKGNFGFLFARPEVGKTTFLASEVSYMLTQLTDDHGPILWLNNEQRGIEVVPRIIQAYFGLTLAQLKSNPAKYNKEFNDAIKGKFKFVDDANLSKADVERHCAKLKPSLIISDQIDKIKGFTNDREDLRLGGIYIWGRELAKQYCPFIAVSQADGSAENQKWLTMENVANAKTAKQAEADWILGIGHKHEEGMQFIRYLHLSKNKLLGDEDTIPRMRHGRMEVLIEPEIARFRDLIKYE